MEPITNIGYSPRIVIHIDEFKKGLEVKVQVENEVQQIIVYTADQEATRAFLEKLLADNWDERHLVMNPAPIETNQQS